MHVRQIVSTQAHLWSARGRTIVADFLTSTSANSLCRLASSSIAQLEGHGLDSSCADGGVTHTQDSKTTCGTSGEQRQQQP
jgi:hypothetical protein